MTRFVLGLIGLSFIAACSSSSSTSDRSIQGVAPAGATDIYAIDTQGRSAHADVVTGEFHVDLEAGAPVVLFFATADGQVAPLVFSNGHGGTQSVIPDFSGAVTLGQITIVDGALAKTDSTAPTAASEQNPLETVDSDGDGTADLSDEDDDGDGTADTEDADVDGDGTDDDDSDLDLDDDGRPDECDEDDDGDGEDDEHDADDDNDGVGDDEDENDHDGGGHHGSEEGDDSDEGEGHGGGDSDEGHEDDDSNDGEGHEGDEDADSDEGEESEDSDSEGTSGGL